MRIAIPDDYQQAVATLDCYHMLANHEVTLVHEYIPDPKHLAAVLNDPEILILTRTRTPVGEPLLAYLPNLKLIAQTGKNAGHIDIAACNRHGVAVAEGFGDPTATAELTWALIMSGLRLLPQAMTGMKAGQWQTNIGRRVKGKVIGIWGYGKIGKRIAQYASAFEASAMVWGSESSRTLALEDGFSTAKSRLDFFRNSDVVSLHLRLRETTTGIVRKTDLLNMKPEALLINTARAALIEPGALVEALREGRPGYAAIDVYDSEPVYAADHPLLGMPNVICTPHLGYVERTSYELYFSTAFENVLNFLAQNPVNIANPEVL